MDLESTMHNLNESIDKGLMSVHDFLIYFNFWL